MCARVFNEMGKSCNVAPQALKLFHPKPTRDRGMDKTIRKFTDFDELKAEEYRYWQSRPVHERWAATEELSLLAYALKHKGTAARTAQSTKTLGPPCPKRVSFARSVQRVKIAPMHTHDFEHLPGTERVLMLHIPTRTTFEIVYDPDQTMLGGLTIHGFAARIVGVTDNGEPPDDTQKLAAIGHEAIVAFLCDERVLSRW
jgi:hypothetical protein